MLGTSHPKHSRIFSHIKHIYYPVDMNKSRSPAPGAVPTPAFATLANRTPVFYPPSHYAAAAGVVQPDTMADFHAMKTPNSQHSTADMYARHSEACLPPASPISYPMQTPVPQSPVPDSTPVPSGSHLNRVSRLISRSPSRSSAKSPRVSGSRANAGKTESARRQSQFVDIPLVEMQLIPTLRDTVDRMTHPSQSPARQDDSETESMDSGNFARWQTSRNHYGAKSPSICLDDPQESPVGPPTRSKYVPSGIPALPVMSDMSMSNPVRSRAPQSSTATSQQQRANSRISQYIPPNLSSNAPSSPRPPLKSALRTQQSCTPPISVASVSQPSKSLRSVRSMTSTGPANISENTSDSPSRARCPSQASALKQPNSLLPVSKYKSKSRSNPATPQLPARIQTYATPQSGSHSPFGSYASNDPSNPPGSARSSANTGDSGSEHEQQLKRSPRSGRPTTKISSSSENEDKAGGAYLASRMRLPAQRKYATPTSGIPVRGARREMSIPAPAEQTRRENLDAKRMPMGLGFRMSPSPEGTRSHFQVALDDSQDESAYDGSTDGSQREDQSNVRQHDEVDHTLVTGRSVRARLLDAVRNHDLASIVEGDSKRRQVALEGIVDGLRSQFGLSPADGRRSVLSQSESDAYYEEGLAIASSGDFRYGSDTHDSTASVAQLPVVEEQWTQEGRSMSAEEESIYSEDEGENGYSSDEVDPPGSLHATPRWSWSRQSTDPPVGSISLSDGSDEQLQARRNSAYRASVSPVMDDRRPQSVLSSSSAREGRRRSNSPQRGPNRRLSGRSNRNSTLYHNSSVPEPEYDGQSSIPNSPPDVSFSRRSTHGDESHRTPRLSLTEDLEGDGVNNLIPVPAVYADAESEDTDENEWEAFGIPRSLSYGASDSSNSENSNAEDVERQSVLLRSESDESLVGGIRPIDSALSSAHDEWDTRGADGAFSKGANALFQVLATGGRKSANGSEKARIRPQDDCTEASNRSQISRNASAEGMQSYDRTPRSPCPSSPTMYDKRSYKIQPMNPSPAAQDSWCSSLQSPVYNALLSKYGPKEMQRQEVIFELLMSEKAMVKRLRIIVQSFILPLRSRNSRSWLPGVPQDVSRLFDWLEDIVNLHRGFERTLKNLTTPWKLAAIVDQVATPLLALIPKFEIYQPYLVRVDEIKEMVADSVADEQSEFGEYVRMREQEGDHDEWTLERLLQEPVNRLNSYPDIFERLLSVTPMEHPDYLASISLLCSTKTIIHVMEEVRIREEEYDFVKDVASHLVGLPDFAPLAKRERRLLHDGLVRWLRPVEDIQEDTPAAPAVQLNGKTLLHSISRKARIQQDESQRASRLASAIHNWHVRRAKSGSISSSASSFSLRSYSTMSSSNATSAAPMSLSHANSDKAEPRHLEVDIKPLQAFVFSDLLVLATLPQETDGVDLEASWQLLDDVGLSRILSITERQENPGRDRVISLNLIPVDASQLEINVCVRSGTVTEMTLVLPASDDDSAESFLAALQQCLERTIHTLSFPGQATDNLSFGPNLEADSDTHHSVHAILASGLPLPKSPSMQFEDQSTDRTIDPSEQEREERGWWSLRFQQVLREFQRQDKSAWLLS